MKSCKVAFLLLPVIYGLLFTSCNKENETDYTYFLIEVDSIQIPNYISTSESFDFILFGIIGTNGCQQFHELKIEQKGNEIFIEAWGKSAVNANACPAVMVYLENERLNYSIHEKGTYTINIKT